MYLLHFVTFQFIFMKDSNLQIFEFVSEFCVDVVIDRCQLQDTGVNSCDQLQNETRFASQLNVSWMGPFPDVLHKAQLCKKEICSNSEHPH